MREFSAAKDVADEEKKAEKASESVVTPMADFFETQRREGAKDGREEGMVGEGVIGLESEGLQKETKGTKRGQAGGSGFGF